MLALPIQNFALPKSNKIELEFVWDAKKTMEDENWLFRCTCVSQFIHNIIFTLVIWRLSSRNGPTISQSQSLSKQKWMMSMDITIGGRFKFTLITYSRIVVRRRFDPMGANDEYILHSNSAALNAHGRWHHNVASMLHTQCSIPYNSRTSTHLSF